MPYKLKKFKTGFKVCKADNMKRCFSKKPLSKQRAIRQMRAIGINESKQTNIYDNLEKLKKNILGGGKQEDENKVIVEVAPKTVEELQKIINKQSQTIEELNQVITNQEEARLMEGRTRKTIDEFVNLNIMAEFRGRDEELIQLMDLNNEVVSAFDLLMAEETLQDLSQSKLGFKLQKHQKEFIRDWSLSVQELCILYYGVGSGKTIIAINCAEQYLEINPDAYVYFLTPSSLVLNTIKEMVRRGIDPRRKNTNGEYQYNFISYQQLLYSQFDFKPNSLLIVDEAHNLRNIRSVATSEKVSARKRVATGNYTLLGNVLADKLISTPEKFVRSIFMTGTLFVNGPEDIEALISIGYKKRPLLDFEKDEYSNMLLYSDEFKRYYNGLISYYRQAFNDPNFPTKKYHIDLIKSNDVESVYFKNDAYFINSRNQAIDEKINFIINFLKKNKKEKTLIYTQFIDRTLKNVPKKKKKKVIQVEENLGGVKEIPNVENDDEKLFKELNNNGFNLVDVKDPELFDDANIDKLKKGKYYGFISGELNQIEKQRLVRLYNEDIIKILIFTLSIKEGISFKETNNILVFQPYWNYAILEQILARGIRFDSHKLKNKSTINLHLLVAYNPEDKAKSKKLLEWKKETEDIFNNDIKTVLFPMTMQEKKLPFKKEPIMVEVPDGMERKWGDKLSFSRDVNMYNRMIDKQAVINAFEKRLAGVDTFEKANNIDNNEFVIEYNKKLYELENAGEKLTIKMKSKLKRDMYKEFYDKNIKNVSSKIKRFLQDSQFTVGKSFIAEKAEAKSIDEDKLRKLLKSNISLTEMLKKLNIDKQMITQFQANFTPESLCAKVVEMSGIKEDKRQHLNILEPTAGIGNFVSQLVKLNNASNYLIECVEYNKVFYDIGRITYENIDNIKWYNADFLKYKNVRPYEYVIGNPPFNIKISSREVVSNGFAGYKNVRYDPVSKQYFKVYDNQLYDVHFVERAYNMLDDNGILCMIISDRFQRDKSLAVFEAFRKSLDYIQKYNKNGVEIIKTQQFKQEKSVAKEMETNFGMVAIKLVKLPNFLMDITGAHRNTAQVIGLTKGLDKKEAKKLLKQIKTQGKTVEKVENEKPTKKKVKKAKDIDDNITKNKELTEEEKDNILKKFEKDMLKIMNKKEYEKFKNWNIARNRNMRNRWHHDMYRTIEDVEEKFDEIQNLINDNRLNLNYQQEKNITNAKEDFKKALSEMGLIIAFKYYDINQIKKEFPKVFKEYMKKYGQEVKEELPKVEKWYKIASNNKDAINKIISDEIKKSYLWEN